MRFPGQKRNRKETAEELDAKAAKIGNLSVVLAKQREDAAVVPKLAVRRLLLRAGGMKGLADKLWNNYESANTSRERSEALSMVMRYLERALVKQPADVSVNDLTDEDLFRLGAYCYEHADTILGNDAWKHFGQDPPAKAPAVGRGTPPAETGHDGAARPVETGQTEASLPVGQGAFGTDIRGDQGPHLP